MSASNAARGPLSILLKSPIAQWVVVGAGSAYTFFPEQVEPYLRKGLAQLGASSFPSSKSNDSSQVPRSIVIHTHTNSDSKKTFLSTLVSCLVGATCVWLSYTICSNYLPESIKEYFPVTRQFFDKATKSLAQGIVNVKNTLSKQILHLSDRQEELGKQQEATHRDVKETQENVKNARKDLSMLQQLMERCEGRLEDTQSIQGYTARGVRLLVRCVASIMPGEDLTLRELADFNRECPDKLKDDTEKVQRRDYRLYDHPDTFSAAARSTTRALPADDAGLEELTPWLYNNVQRA